MITKTMDRCAWPGPFTSETDRRPLGPTVFQIRIEVGTTLVVKAMGQAIQVFCLT